MLSHGKPLAHASYACSGRLTTAKVFPRTVRTQADPDHRRSSNPQDASTGHFGKVKPPAAAEDGAKGVAYYSGLVNNDLRQDNRASPADMLVRNLQLAADESVPLPAL
ncbi:hypothetical protein VOLCADRAFT_95504 [Volvox carteri f. nagariensis]|uniref:Uncharacterized protein n=1 Tax=Volvox carteri f. nagariensis TaxID=3068 RepID=D8U7M9_VOLCA|nr:uncharacterized protein VOLCADRAFT_95504 [Volvox carteri f. nagariensis]EFJ44329.1 hypothetical protein VOLCADRAFT_95504 [Volvox carteri f. nagariensis]|eukprot:XP_002954688.1 hypothetical protein VOLCADRAFT_95504 [Volvox carteri f. nagariensis]